MSSKNVLTPSSKGLIPCWDHISAAPVVTGYYANSKDCCCDDIAEKNKNGDVGEIMRITVRMRNRMSIPRSISIWRWRSIFLMPRIIGDCDTTTAAWC